MTDETDPPPDDGGRAGEPDRPQLPTGPLPMWRVPIRTPIILITVAVVCVLWNVLGDPSITIRAVTIVLALACLATSFVVRRTHLIVEPEGVAIRFVQHEEFIAWHEIVAIDVIAGLRGSATVRFRCVDGSQVDVPPSLFAPSRQSSRAVAARRLEQVAAQLREYWHAFGGGQSAA